MKPDLPATVLRPGDYIFEINKAFDSVSKKGNPTLRIWMMAEMTCVDLYDAIAYTEGSRPALNAFLASIGQEIVLGEGDRIVAADLFWQRGYARVGLDEYNGRPFNPILRWLTPSSAEMKKRIYTGNFRPVRVIRAPK